MRLDHGKHQEENEIRPWEAPGGEEDGQGFIGGTVPCLPFDVIVHKHEMLGKYTLVLIAFNETLN